MEIAAKQKKLETKPAHTYQSTPRASIQYEEIKIDYGPRLLGVQ
jgi:hypothetical protein